MRLKWIVHNKFTTDEQKAIWWCKFAAVRRRRVWQMSEQQNHRCCYCSGLTWVFDGVMSCDQQYVADRLPGMSQKKMATADHLIPESEGGSEHPSNLVMACKSCNALRECLPALEFWEIMQDRDKLRQLIADRNAKRERNTKERTIKRQPKRDYFVLQLGFLLFCSQDARLTADEIMTEIAAHAVRS